METFDHIDDELFSHDKNYQVKHLISATSEIDTDKINESLEYFLKSIQWNHQLKGDYVFVMSEWKQNITDKYYFPLYE